MLSLPLKLHIKHTAWCCTISITAVDLVSEGWIPDVGGILNMLTAQASVCETFCTFSFTIERSLDHT